MTVYKWEVQMRAEGIAEEEYGCHVHDLPEETRSSIFQRAMLLEQEQIPDAAGEDGKK